MVSGIVGGYLVEKGLITPEQLAAVQEEKSRIRVKMGLIAVAEGLMTQEEADEVNRMQAVMDKRFGDIAVEQGYLTEGQVWFLLEKQRNAYLAFAQALENQELLSIEQLERTMLDFQEEYQLSDVDMEDLKSDDIDRVLPLFLKTENSRYLDMAGTVFRMIMRCLDHEAYPLTAYTTQNYENDNGATQKLDREYDVTCAFAGKGDALLRPASLFYGREFEQVDLDVLDAIGEVLNYINGLYASALSRSGVQTEIYPPEYYENGVRITGEEMLVLPIVIGGQRVDFVVVSDYKPDEKGEE